jgi:hypothetical protein
LSAIFLAAAVKAAFRSSVIGGTGTSVQNFAVQSLFTVSIMYAGRPFILSRQANLIFVCSSCNIKKRDSTLRRFIEETGLDEKAIHERLLSLAKDF